MNKRNRELLNDAEDRAIKKLFPVKEDMLLMRVEYTPSYKNIKITSVNKKISVIFNSKNFVKDFNNAIVEGKRIMNSGGFETVRHNGSMNSFSGGMLLTSSCDDFLTDSKDKYSYIYSTENPGDFNVIGVKKNF